MAPPSHCDIPTEPNYTGVKVINLTPSNPLNDYISAMQMADSEASKYYEDKMLIAWYDRDRDFESPQHASECHVNSAIPGYIDYALYHGATMKIDIEQGRFIFFYISIDF